MLKGLPIGVGEAWRDVSQRRWLLMLAVLALLPFFGLLAAAWRWLGLSQAYGWLITPALGALTVCLVIVTQRYPVLRQRLLVGFMAGWAGAIAVDTVHLLGATWGPWASQPLVWSGLYPSTSDPAWWLAGYFNHWVLTGGLWGTAYGLLAGKARWAYGLVFSGVFGLVAAIVGVAAPAGWVLLPPASFAMLLGLFGAHAIYGVVLGLINERWQAEPYHGAKIIFLRDYQARVKERN